MWKFLGAVVCGLSAVLVLSLIAVPIQAWPAVAPFGSYLRPVAAWVPCIILVFAASMVLAELRWATGPGARALAVIGIVVAFLWPAYALAQDAAASTTVNLGDVFRDFREGIVTVVGIVVASLVAFVATAVRKSAGVTIDVKMQERLQSVAMTGVHLGMDQVEHLLDSKNVDVKSKIVAGAIQYIRLNAPKEVKHFKLTDGAIDALARAKLQEAMPQRTLVGIPPASGLPPVRGA